MGIEIWNIHSQRDGMTAGNSEERPETRTTETGLEMFFPSMLSSQSPLA